MRTPPERPVLTVREPRDLIALVPYRLGFVPQDSVVLIAIGDPPGHVGLLLRTDLANAEAMDLAHAQDLVSHVVDDGADRVVAVVYRRERLDDLPWWLDLLADVLARAGAELVDAWQVDGTTFRSLLCAEQACCPPDGWPVEHLESSVVSAAMVGLGRSPARDRAGLLPDLDPLPEDVRRRVAARVRRATTGEPSPSERLRRLRAWQRCLAAGDVPDETDAALALAALDDPWVRDAVVLTVAGTDPAVVDELALCGSTERTEAALAGLFGDGPAGAPEPVEEIVLRARGALERLTRHARGTRRADPLAVLAWAAWWCGDGALAHDLVDVALDAHVDHGLARLVKEAVLRGTPPAWTRSRRRERAGRGATVLPFPPRPGRLA